MHSEELPSPRVQFVEKSTIAGLEKGQRTRASRLLSPRERAVAALLVQGHTLKSVAKELGISRHTVSRYLSLGDWQPYDSRNRSSQQ